MGLFDVIKSCFKPTEEENRATKETLEKFVKQATKKENLNDFEVVYGKFQEQKDSLTTKKTVYYNYAVAFNNLSGELVILPVDPKLASCGWPVFINSETLKQAKTTLMGTVYQFDLKDGDTIMFDVPAVNYKIGKMLGAMDLAILQEDAAKAFKAFFNTRFK